MSKKEAVWSLVVVLVCLLLIWLFTSQYGFLYALAAFVLSAVLSFVLTIVRDWFYRR